MPDRFVVRAVVISLGVIALAVIIGAIALSIGNHSIPEALWTIAGTAVGAVAGILSKTNTEPGPVQPVQVVNTTSAPVPVDQAEPGVQPAPMTVNVTTSADPKTIAREIAWPTRRWNAKLNRPVPSAGNPPVG